MRLVLSCLCLAASVGARADEPVRTREAPPAPASAPKAEVESPAPASDLGTLRKLGPSNLVKGKYLFSRGLGDRYSNALLNGVPLPSSDPDRRAIPMGALSPILKSGARLENFYLPDSPADFSGGSLRLRAEDYPKERRLQIELRGSANTQ